MEIQRVKHRGQIPCKIAVNYMNTIEFFHPKKISLLRKVYAGRNFIRKKSSYLSKNQIILLLLLFFIFICRNPLHIYYRSILFYTPPQPPPFSQNNSSSQRCQVPAATSLHTCFLVTQQDEKTSTSS